MKKIFTSLFLVAIFSLNVFANPVDVKTAKQIGQTFLARMNEASVLKSYHNLELVYEANTNANSKNTESLQTTYFYVFNAETDGFVIVAGDDNVIPILGYSHEGSFHPNNIPPNMQKWLESYKTEIRYAIENNITATEEIQTEWQELKADFFVKTSTKSLAVSPLVNTKWGQGNPYNAQCPGSGNNKAVTGCVATAMAQIMKYWNYPAQGTGSHSYRSQNYGQLSANFGNTTYQWSLMPVPSTTSSNSAVATLMYHCGVSVDMNYGPQESGAYVISAASPLTHCAEYALKTYFGYKNSLRGIQRNNYTETQWINLLKTELNAARPVLYVGYGDEGGHAFVCDGYDNNNYFHFNWGWRGTSDGYFYVSALNPGNLGTGGGSGGFNTHQQAIIGIEPSSSIQNHDLRLYTSLSMSNTSIWFGNSISVTVKIANYGYTTFQGTFGAAILNSEGVFIDFLSTSPQTLSAGYNVEKTFTNSGGPPFIPGNYVVVIYSKTTDGEWKVVANGNYTNSRAFNIHYSSDIETRSDFTYETLIQNQSATVNVSIKNAGTSTFYGKFRVSLANLDGSHVQNIDIADAPTSGLQANYYYLNGLNFTGTITATPGTYLMSLAYQRVGESRWTYAGSSDYQNPIFVIVEPQPLQPDIYEPNNTQAQARDLSVNFFDNNANVKTTGSNLHIETDIDYYKIVLPSGYNYTVKPRLHDSRNSANGETYTVDAMFSYSTNGTTYSEGYDDVMPGNISVENGGTIYFKVTPFFSGDTGTYLLDVQITRSLPSNINNIESNNQISIYPNPANDFVIIDFQNFSENVNRIVLCDIQGRQIYSENFTAFTKTINLPLKSISNGIYFVEIYSAKGVLTKKLIVQK